MDLVGILKALLSFAGYLAKYIEEKNLMDAGEARVVSTNLQEAFRAINRAKAAKSAIRDTPDDVRNDPDNLDGGH